MLADIDLDNIEAAALGRTGVGVFAHPADTLLLVAEVRRLRKELREISKESETAEQKLVREAREMASIWPPSADDSMRANQMIRLLSLEVERLYSGRPSSQHIWCEGLLSQCVRCGEFPSFLGICDPKKLEGKTQPCCECGNDYPAADLIAGEIYCPKCRTRKDGGKDADSYKNLPPGPRA